jgi:hypothetical protein
MLQNIIHAIPPKRSNQFRENLPIIRAHTASDLQSNFLTERNPDWKTDSFMGAAIGVCSVFCCAIFSVGLGMSIRASAGLMLRLRFFNCSSSLLTSSTGLLNCTFRGRPRPRLEPTSTGTSDFLGRPRPRLAA